MKKLFITLSIIAAAFTCFAQQTIELNNWKFQKGDNLEWAQPGFDDSGWKPIEIECVWESQGYWDLDGYAWYRMTFKLPSGLKDGSLLKDSLFISLGKIDDCDQSFLNGKVLGQNGKTLAANFGSTLSDLSRSPSMREVVRHYTLSVNDPRLVWDKENVLAVRVFDKGEIGGMFRMSVNIRMKSLKDYLVFNDSRPLEPKSKGMVSKTIVLENHSSLTGIKGTLKVEIAKNENNQLLGTQTFPVNLKKKPLSLAVDFKGTPDMQVKPVCTFTEAKTGEPVVYAKESDCAGGWEKYTNNPVLGGDDLGTIFDVSILKTGEGLYRMYYSMRNKRAIAFSESRDGFSWTAPKVCFKHDSASYWQKDVNRPVVIKKDGLYHLWYTGQAGGGGGNSWIGYATSRDGINWTRMSSEPVLKAELPWEKTSVMCPHIIWDEQENLFKLWYSAGEQWEPDAIGYATSKDGLHWEKYKNNPIFFSDHKNKWELHKVAGCQVIKRANDYLMFYIGYQNIDIAQIGMARSKDGITGWERYKDNPLIRLGTGWDSEAVYKPFAIPEPENNRWLLYYNARRAFHEQIGVAIHKGMDLGF